jgi:hypothetical protein
MEKRAISSPHARQQRRSEGHTEKLILILVESSVWIDFLSPSPSSKGAELRQMIAEATREEISSSYVKRVKQLLIRGARAAVPALWHLETSAVASKPANGMA